MKAITPANGPVNVKRFTIYAMIPGLDTYAVSKLDKKKPATIITIVSIIGILIVTGIIMYQMSTDPEIALDLEEEVRKEMIFAKYMPQIIWVILGFSAIYLPFIAFLVNKWAKEWNSKFEI